MAHSRQCVIIGASHGGVQAAQRVRRLGWTGDITLVGEEDCLPYHRPPLSKDYLKGNKDLASIALNAQAAFDKAEIRLKLGSPAVRIDRDGRRVELANGDRLDYDKLILAVGSSPRRLPGSLVSGVCYLRDSADADKIRAAGQAARHAVIVGGGYIGLEVAASLRALGLEVTVLEAMDRILQRVSCETLSRFFTRVHNEEGVDVRTSALLKTVHGDGRVSGVSIADGDDLEADLVVVGIGVVPNIELAEQAGLEIDNGIVVNEFTQTSDPDIHAIGDCANIHHRGYDRKIRLESVQNANDQAVIAARYLCGDPAPYEALPWFWSDQYDVKLQIAGLAEGADQQIVRGDPDSGRSLSILHLQGNRLLCVEAANQPRDFAQGKKLIADQVALDTDRLADPDCALRDAVVE